MSKCRRHFGGVKLGAGGLVRAYGGAARECLRAAEHCTVLPQRQVSIQVWSLNCIVMHCIRSETSQADAEVERL